MTPDQLHRRQLADCEVATIRRMLQRIPEVVINGGYNRAVAYKTAALAAQKLLRSGAADPSKLREARLSLESACFVADSVVASIANGQR